MRGSKRFWMVGVIALIAIDAACGSDDHTATPQPTSTPSAFVSATSLVVTQVPDAPPASSQPNVFLWPADIVADGNGMAKFDVWVNTGNIGISGGEVTLNYGDSGCTVQAFASGPLLGENPLVGHGTIDNEDGIAVLALARVGTTQVPSSPGSFATVTLGCPSSAQIDIPSLELKALMADHQFKEVPLVGGSPD